MPATARTICRCGSAPAHRRRQCAQSVAAAARSLGPSTLELNRPHRSHRPHRPLRLASAGQTVKIPDHHSWAQPGKAVMDARSSAINRSTRAWPARTRKAFGGKLRPPSTGSKSQNRVRSERGASTAAGSSAGVCNTVSTRSIGPRGGRRRARRAERRSSMTRRSPAKNAPSPITAC